MTNIPSTYPPEAVGAAIDQFEKSHIDNKLVQAACLSVIAKETGFKLRSETSYAGTSNARIRQVFGSRLKDLSEDQLTKLKANPSDFFDKVYGGRYGNTAKGDGYKYRGRGYNQITFKANYKAIGDIIGHDLVNNPDLLNSPLIAAAASAAYFVIFFRDGKNSGALKKKIGVNDLSEIKDLTTAVKAAIQANAGWGTDFNTAIVQEGFKKALESVGQFATSLTNSIKKNPGTTVALFFLLGWA